MTAPTIYQTEADWLAARKQSVGASEAAAVLGANPYASALSVYAAKVEGQVQVETRAMRAGKILERGILELWASGDESCQVQPTSGHQGWSLPEFHMSCTPDALATLGGSPVVAEIKNVSPQNRSWDDGPPLYYVVQVQVQLGILRACDVPADYGVLVSYHGGDDLREFKVEPDGKLFELASAKIQAFWREHVIPKVPPAPDKFATADDVRRAWRKEQTGKAVEVEPALVARLIEAKAALKVHEYTHDEASRDLLAALGDAELAQVNGLTVATWKTIKRKGYTVEPGESRRLTLTKAAELTA